MVRFVIRLMLSFFSLFLGGFAHPSGHLTHHSPGKGFDRLLLQHFSSVPNDDGVFRRGGYPGTRKERNKTKAIVVEEDDETISFKKYMEIGHSDATYYGVLSNKYISYYLKDRLPFCEHFSYYSADKFIVQRVIRV